MPRPAMLTSIVIEKILSFLAPLFFDDTTNDPIAARQAASETLASYGARNNRELRLAALAIAFGFGALDALCRAADPDLALNQVIRLRCNANALNRAANQSENKLEKLRKQAAAATQPAEPDPAPADDLPTTSATLDLLAFVRAAPTASPSIAAAPVPTPLSRQQRRAAERSAEKLRRQQQAAAEKARRTAQRSPTFCIAAKPAAAQPIKATVIL